MLNYYIFVLDKGLPIVLLLGKKFFRSDRQTQGGSW